MSLVMSQGRQGERLLAGRYRLLSVVGRGGMGTVWRARDEVLDREIAVKEVIVRRDLADDEREVLLHRTLREARATARLNHPGIVTVHDVVEEDGRPWIVMEFVTARPLQLIIDEDGPQPPRRVAEIGRQTLAALMAAHSVGILHRDVKPGNVLITDEGRAVLTDFGIAQVEGDSTLTHTGLIVGSPAYISPERINGERATTAADLWALGATLYAACEGRPPHAQTGAMAVFAAILTQDPVPPRNAGPLTPVLQGLLHRDPDHRMDAGTTATMLTRVAAGDAPQPPARPGAEAGLPWTSAAATRAEGSQGAVPAGPWPHEGSPVERPNGRTAPSAHLVASPAGTWPPASMGTVATAGVGTAPAGVGAAPASKKRSLGLFAMIAVLVSVVIVLIGLLVTMPDNGATLGVHGAAPLPAGSTPSAAGPSVTTTTAGQEPTLPAGWRRYEVLGATAGVPGGWRRADSGRALFWHDPSSAAYLQLDRIPWQGDPYNAWLQWEAEVKTKRSLPGYERLSLRPVTGEPYKAADIEFTWFGAGGKRMHGIDRRIIAGKRRYTIFAAMPADRWSASRARVDGLLGSFRP
jgi:tRNA A-37 threonylcarbamoyl transferase component Bud32